MAIYRVIHHDADHDESWYGLHEVRFGDDGKIVWWDLEPAQFSCDGSEGREEVAQALVAAAEDADRWPALKASELPQ